MSAQGVRGARLGVDTADARVTFGWQMVAVLLLVAAALSPATPPTAVGIVQPGSYTSLWSFRVGGTASLLELGLLALAGFVVIRHPRVLALRSTLDGAMTLFAAAVAVLQFLALSRNGPALLFQSLDLELIALPFAGYLLVSRLAPGPRGLRVLAGVVGVSLAANFAYLVIRHGWLGSTEFGLVSGQRALLITEDSLLIAFPVVMAWGLLTDRLLSRGQAVAALALLVAAVLVNLASLRRGALIFLGTAVGGRSLWAPRKWVLRGGVIAVVAVAAALAGPARPLLDDARYVVESALLQTEDASTGQRQSELTNFTRNVDGPADALFGKGLGAIWNLEAPAPIDAAAFGSGETEYVRVGWHVYGLDWLYKLGIAGLLGALLAAALAVKRLRAAARDAGDRIVVSILRSAAVMTPVLALFLFTNPRLGFFAGVSAGLASAAADILRRGSTPSDEHQPG